MRTNTFLGSFGLLAALLPALVASAQNVVTFHYNNARDGQNTNETILTPGNVNSTNFGLLFKCPVDGYIYAQPLYVTNVSIPGQGVHDVVFVATENDSVYAFDADSNEGENGGLLWHADLGIALVSTNYGIRYHHNVLNPLIGITGTPVIDPAAGTLYVDVFHGTVSNTPAGFHTLHALDIATGADQPYSPVFVAASVPGTGVDSSNGVVRFNASYQMNRPALTLAGGNLYVAYGSYGDTDPYHGWVIGFNATNLLQLTNFTFATTPNATISAFGTNAGEGALWMSGDGLCADDAGNLYFESGNGSFSANTNGGDYGDCFVRLSASNRLAVADYFAPSNQATMAANDLDLGSGGPILLPNSVGSPAHSNLMVGVGKEGTIYLLDRNNMGHFSASTNYLVQQTKPGAIGGVWGVPAYHNGLMYFLGVSDELKAFSISNGVMSLSPVSQTSAKTGSGVGYTPSISANGASNAIAWVINTDAYTTNGPAVLYAYNATNLSQLLYSSAENAARDAAGGAVKYATPVVADGKVYVSGEYELSVYGLLPAPTLTVSRGAGTLYFSWPTNTTLSYSVEFRTNLFSGNWSVLTNQVVATNGVFRISLPPNGPGAFYRLKH